MSDPTSDFFAELGRRGHEPLLETATGTLRFDLLRGRRTERFLLSISRGDLTISKAGGAADCVVRAERALFDDIACGRASAWSAVLRGAVMVEGDVRLLLLVQRLFPGPTPDDGGKASA